MSPVQVPENHLFLQMAAKPSGKHKKLIFKGSIEAEYNTFLKQIGESIRSRRVSMGLTQEDFDTQPLAIDDRNFRRIEAGTRNVTVKTLFAICKQLKVQPKELFDFDIKF